MNSKKDVRNGLKNRAVKPGYALRCLAALFLIGSIGACAATVLPPEWGFQREAIELNLISDQQLNDKNGTPHTLFVCVYQLRNPVSFDRLATDPVGLYKLLECEMFDPSVGTSNRLFVHPGQNQHAVFDRAEGARHVAVVAGYYTIEKERIVRVFDIPVDVEVSGFLSRKKQEKPRHIKIEMTLGPKQILAAKGK